METDVGQSHVSQRASIEQKKSRTYTNLERHAHLRKGGRDGRKNGELLLTDYVLVSGECPSFRKAIHLTVLFRGRTHLHCGKGANKGGVKRVVRRPVRRGE